MIIYDKIIQGTDEWKELKHGKIGGSSASDVMTKLDKSITECAVFSKILAEHMEDFDPFTEGFQNAAMQRGNELEPIARQEYERIFQLEVTQVGWVELENRMVGISPDGMIPAQNQSIEIKCPTASTHAKYLLDENLFLEDYAWQLVHNFLVLGIDFMDCISYRPENKFTPLWTRRIHLDTEIKISAKVTKPIRELVVMLDVRLNELEVEVKKAIKQLNKQLEF